MVMSLKSTWPQWLGTMGVMFVLMQFGLMGGWMSPTMIKLTADDSEVPITLDEASWVASIINLGRIFGAIAGGFTVYFYGSKMSLFLTSLSIAFSWIFVGTAESFVWLCVARTLGGFGIGMGFSCFPLYLGEISDPSIRGSLVSVAMSGISIGSLIASAVCAFFSINTSSIMFFIPCLLVMGLFAYLPESPHHLIRQKNPKNAKLALAWYDRGCDIEMKYSSLEKYVEISNSQSFWKNLDEFKRPEMRKALYIVLMLFMYMQMCGLNTIVFYMESILRDAKSTIFHPSQTVIVVSTCALIASWFSMYLIERFGRRILLIISSLGVSLALGSLSAHFILLDDGFDSNKLEAIPVVSLMIFQFSIFIGLMTVPSTVLSEIFPPSIKCLAATTASITSAIFAFLCSKTFQPLLDLLGQKYVYMIYVGIILSAVPFALICMPETKGKSLQQIQQDIAKKS